MKLTNILNELHGKYSTFELCFKGYIPLSLPLTKKLVKPKRKIVFHVTDVDHLDNLHRMEGKSKALSTFTDTRYDWIGPLMGQGMRTKGGVLVVLSGIVLAESWVDLWTLVDESGRRWAKPDTLIHEEFEGRVIDYAPKRIKILRNKYFTSDGLTNKEKNEFITGYINAAHKLLLKNRHWFQTKYIHNKFLDFGAIYNELVVSKIRVEKIYIITDYTDYQPKEKQEWALKTYPNAEEIEIADIKSLIRKWSGK